MALYLQGLPLLLMRSTMLEVMHEEFVTMARMKGLSEWRIVIRHAARNALLPVVTAFALGLGRHVGANVRGRDRVQLAGPRPAAGRRPCRRATIRWRRARSSCSPLVLVAMNFVADLLYGVLDPRVSHDRSG